MPGSTYPAPLLSSISWLCWSRTRPLLWLIRSVTHTHAHTETHTHTEAGARGQQRTYLSGRSDRILQCLYLCFIFNTLLNRKTPPLCCGRRVKSSGDSPPRPWVTLLLLHHRMNSAFHTHVPGQKTDVRSWWFSYCMSSTLSEWWCIGASLPRYCPPPLYALTEPTFTVQDLEELHQPMSSTHCTPSAA